MFESETPVMDAVTAAPSLRLIFLIFAKLGATSIGGGVNGMMHAEFVVARRWFTDEEFLSGLAVSQALPGVNVANLALWLGYRKRGLIGALTALAAVVIPPAIIIVLIGGWLFEMTAVPAIGALLAGLAAAAAGLSIAVGYRAVRHACVDIFSIALFVAALLGAILLHLSAVVLVCSLGPVGVCIGFARIWHERR
jgi:chromate transporter